LMQNISKGILCKCQPSNILFRKEQGILMQVITLDAL
jgi:hypothetical protein